MRWRLVDLVCWWTRLGSTGIGCFDLSPMNSVSLLGFWILSADFFTDLIH